MEAGGNAVVTGASRGIGRGVALELAAAGVRRGRDDARPDGGRGPAELAAAAGGQRCGSSASTSPTPAGSRCPTELRVLVNNAGVEARAPGVRAHAARALAADVRDECLRAHRGDPRAIPALRAAGGGVLCNVTSSSILAPVPFYAPYRASKAAVSVLGESLRTELAPFGIRVLEIMPGPIDTDMLEGSARPAGRGRRSRLHGDGLAACTRAGRAVEDTDDVDVEAEAARAIADAILDDDAPLHVRLRSAGRRPARPPGARRPTRTSCRR